MVIKFAYHNCKKLLDAEIVLVGVPDEQGSTAKRQGASQGPQAIRKASKDRLTFSHKGKTNQVIPERGLFSASLFDQGDIKKKDLTKFIKNLAPTQFPIVLGGDHSITYFTIKGLADKYKKLAVVYLDAHPDLVSSQQNYYGSVVFDICEFPHINPKQIVEVGIRSIEPEERRNLKNKKIKSFTALDLSEQGVLKIFSKIKRIVGRTPTHLSIDLDVIDPAFAPGVDMPAPFGLTSNEYLSLIKQCAKKLNLVGLGIMEMSPRYDIQQRTAQLAAKSIVEIVGSKK
tara:strand:+ start:230 stop:1087 length:858 start_codon:yes stop_codon:yes gene_type:complete